jgi:hypothetical protein
MEGERIPKRVLEWKQKWSQRVGETEEDQGKDGLRTLKKIYR